MWPKEPSYQEKAYREALARAEAAEVANLRLAGQALRLAEERDAAREALRELDQDLIGMGFRPKEGSREKVRRELEGGGSQ